jgi:hypothetical protein
MAERSTSNNWSIVPPLWPNRSIVHHSGRPACHHITASLGRARLTFDSWLFGNLFSTLTVLCTQQRCPRT